MASVAVALTSFFARLSGNGGGVFGLVGAAFALGRELSVAVDIGFRCRGGLLSAAFLRRFGARGNFDIGDADIE